MDKEGSHNFPASSNVKNKNYKVDGIYANPKPRFHNDEGSPENCKGSYSRRQFHNHSKKEKEGNSFDDLKTTSDEDGSDESSYDCFENLVPLKSSDQDDPLVFDNDTKGFDEKVDVRKFYQARLSGTGSESDEEELRPAAEIKKVCDALVAGERKVKQYNPFLDSKCEFDKLAEFAVKDFKASKEADTEQEMTFTHSESEDEVSEPAAECIAFKIQVQSEKEAMTFTDSESEPEDEEPPSADTDGSKVADASDEIDAKQGLIFTDSESEDNLPLVLNETGLEKLSAAAHLKVSKEEEAKQEMTFNFTACECEGEESSADYDLLTTHAQHDEEEINFTDDSERKVEGEMTFSDTESDEFGSCSEEELIFTDSESEDEQPTFENFFEKASDDPEFGELTQTDANLHCSESEKEK